MKRRQRMDEEFNAEQKALEEASRIQSEIKQKKGKKKGGKKKKIAVKRKN